MSSTKQSNGRGLALAGYNYVGQDQIWKDHVTNERQAARSWGENWNFLTTGHKELIAEEEPEATKKKEPIPIPDHLRVAPASSIHDYVTVMPSTKPFPKTSAGQIGWRSGDENLKLEKYGRYARPKGGLVKALKWPKEAIG